MKDINLLFSELAQYTNILDDTTAIVESLKDEIKQYMAINNLDEVIGKEHKATYKQVKSNRLDTKALKLAYPDIVQEYTKENITQRFIFK